MLKKKNCLKETFICSEKSNFHDKKKKPPKPNSDSSAFVRLFQIYMKRTILKI